MIIYVLLGLSLLLNAWCVWGVIELCKTVNVILDMLDNTKTTFKSISNRLKNK